jgi:hypothetical protein
MRITSFVFSRIYFTFSCSFLLFLSSLFPLPPTILF